MTLLSNHIYKAGPLRALGCDVGADSTYRKLLRPESAECSGLVFVSCIVLENMSIFSRCFKSIPHRSISRVRLDRCGAAEGRVGSGTPSREERSAKTERLVRTPTLITQTSLAGLQLPAEMLKRCSWTQQKHATMLKMRLKTRQHLPRLNTFSPVG